MQGSQYFERTNTVGGDFKKAHPGTAGESDELQVWRKSVESTDRTLDHVTIDLGFDVHFLLLLVR